jgi:hypothetical protein
LTKNREKEFAVLPYEEFLIIKELLEELEDVRDLRAAKKEEENSPSVSLTEVKRMMKL